MTPICPSARLRAAYQVVFDLNDRAWATLSPATIEQLNQQRKAFDNDRCGLEQARPLTKAVEDCAVAVRKQEADLIRRFLAAHQQPVRLTREDARTKCSIGAGALFPNMLDAFESALRDAAYRKCMINNGQQP
jgi:hypothetical protein